MRRRDPTEGHPWTALEEMRTYYADRVPYHDEYMSWTGREEMEGLLAPIIDLVGPEVLGRDVLEVGCGTGNWTQTLSHMARSVVATDLIKAYIEVAKQKEFPPGSVTFRQADAYSLEGVGGPFDAAVAADLWSHIPRSMVGTFLQSLASVLRPSARVIVIDMLRDQWSDLAFHRFDAEGNEVQLRTLPNGEAYQVIKNYPDEEELHGLLGHWARDAAYKGFPDLGRWVLRFTMRP